MSLQDAYFNVVHDYPGGAASLGPRLGKTGASLSHECSRTGTAKAGLLDAEKITIMTGDLRILSAFAINCGQMLVPLPTAAVVLDDDCMLRLADTAAAFGGLSGSKISDNELHRINRECGGLIASLHALIESIAARNAATTAQ